MPLLQRIDVTERECLHIGAREFAEKGDRIANLLDREAEITCTTNEAKMIDVGIIVTSMAAVAPSALGIRGALRFLL